MTILSMTLYKLVGQHGHSAATLFFNSDHVPTICGTNLSICHINRTVMVGGTGEGKGEILGNGVAFIPKNPRFFICCVE